MPQKNVEFHAVDPTFKGGTVAAITNTIVCRECGSIATQCVSYVWKGTKRQDLIELGMGASVKHYYTECPVCKCNSYS